MGLRTHITGNHLVQETTLKKAWGLDVIRASDEKSEKVTMHINEKEKGGQIHTDVREVYKNNVGRIQGISRDRIVLESRF